MTGTRMAVIIPITPMASPLMAPSIAPNSIARAVPSPCAAEPSANPLATRLFIPRRYSMKGPEIPPKIPTTTTTTAAMEGMPPERSAMLMAIGVVTDFGSSDAINAGSAPK